MLKLASVLFAALLISLALFAWVESYSSSFQNCVNQGSAKIPNNQSNDQENSSTIVLRSYMDCTEGFADSHAPLITAFATFLLAVITSGLILSGVQQLNTNRAQLRGYVFVSSAKVTNVIESMGIPEAHVVIKNFGQTPAYKVMNVSGIAADRFPGPPTLNLIIRRTEFSSSNRTKSDLGPTQSEESITSAGRVLTDDERRAIANGNGAIWVYGEIHYIDAFGKRRRTKYRFMMGGPVGVRPGGQLVACEEGNEAT
jgi:hypothetical protein